MPSSRRRLPRRAACRAVFPSECGASIDADIVLIKDDLEHMLERIDEKALQDARRRAASVGSSSKITVAIEFCEIMKEKDPRKLCAITAFLDYCIERAGRN